MSRLTVPYLSRLEGANIQPGQTFKVQGSITGDSFEVLFMSGSSVDQSDLPFLLAVHRKDKKLTMNDRKSGQLGKEQSKKDPFKHSDRFDLRIRIRNDRFQIFANLKQVAEFEYRQPLTSITNVYVTGNIELNNVSWGGKHYPVPYQAQIDGNFTPGKQLIITGLPEKKADKITINLSNHKNEILLHCQLRFHQKSVVFNSNLNGQFGNEEIEHKIPLKPETLFDILIVCEKQTFQIYIDNEFFRSYTHRADPSSIERICIENDVELFGVYFK